MGSVTPPEDRQACLSGAGRGYFRRMANTLVPRIFPSVEVFFLFYVSRTAASNAAPQAERRGIGFGEPARRSTSSLVRRRAWVFSPNGEYPSSADFPHRGGLFSIYVSGTVASNAAPQAERRGIGFAFQPRRKRSLREVEASEYAILHRRIVAPSRLRRLRLGSLLALGGFASPKIVINCFRLAT